MLERLKSPVFLLVFLFFISSCSGENSGHSGTVASVPVTVSSIIQKTVPVQLRAIGSVEAYSVVSVKALVGGELIRVHFTEGQDVKKRDLLFTIDPRPFEAALKQVEANLGRDRAQVKQAEANLEKDLAQMENAKVEAERYRVLLERGVVARQQYDKLRTDAEALEATVRASRAARANAEAAVKADQAAVENARLQLSYCFIRSPMDGRTGNLMVKQGNVVKANDIALIAINQVHPIYVTFSVPEQNLPEVRKRVTTGKLKVEAMLPGDEKGREEGVLTFIDNAVDTATGTIRLKGTFANKENRLWPGQFVDVILTLSTLPNAVVAPSRSIQTGQEGPYVFVVKADRTVESRPVLVGQAFHDETVIQKGLSPGETVVTDGQIRLRPGSRVEIKTPESTVGKAP